MLMHIYQSAIKGCERAALMLGMARLSCGRRSANRNDPPSQMARAIHRKYRTENATYFSPYWIHLARFACWTWEEAPVSWRV